MRTGEAWECPQLAVYEDGRALLLTSAWYQRTGPGQVVAWAGTADGDRYHFGAPFRFDHGPDFYAPALLRAPDERWLLWGWSWEARERPGDWAGVLTLPREVTLTPDGRAHQAPARELVGLRTGRPLTVVRDALPGESVELGTCAGATDITVRIDFGAEAAWGLRVVTGDDPAEYLDLAVVDGALLVDRGHASGDPRAHVGTCRMPLPQAAPGHSVELRLILDHSIAEVFSDLGEALTLRHYPSGTGPWRLLSRGLAAHPVQLDLVAHTLSAPAGDER
ncbi:GH32 C-terminal domain-containing protein [Streptomyces sp. E11-3]|uniref:GH32 C-terminal domain-containing protein n=1 Tax=Streptomyces sp. E11-3 TaxID=3110112 RepID=UPI00398168FC